MNELLRGRNKGRMKLPLSCLSVAATIGVLACSGTTSAPGPGGSDAGGTIQAGPSADAGTSSSESSDAGAADVSAADTALVDEKGDADVPAGCSVLVNLNGKVETSGAVVIAGKAPTLCWTVPASALPPGPDGWDLMLFRDDAPSGSPEDSEWTIIRGIPGAKRSIVYGDCPPKALGCFSAKTLRPGAHTLSIWDGTREGGAGGELRFTVMQ